MRAHWALALCFLASSCGDTSSDGGTDASIDAAQDATTDAPPDAGTDSGPTGCNALANVGTVVQQMFVATDPVAGQGGTLVAGTYVLTAAAVYTGASGASGPTGMAFRDTVAIQAGGPYQRVVAIVDGAGLDRSTLRQSGTFAVNGSAIQITQTCPPGAQPFTSFDADATKIKLYAPPAGAGNPGVMFEYTKQ